MPELPEVETVRRALVPVLEQRTIEAAYVGRPDLRWPLPKISPSDYKAAGSDHYSGAVNLS